MADILTSDEIDLLLAECEEESKTDIKTNVTVTINFDSITDSNIKLLILKANTLGANTATVEEGSSQTERT